jgi:hypothetical protein
MAYSLLFNSHLIYYHSRVGQIPSTGDMRKLLQMDEEQLALDAESLLANADCFSAKDKVFIYKVIDKNFDSQEDMVNTIKAFIQSVQQHQGTGQSSAADTAADGSIGAAVQNPMLVDETQSAAVGLAHAMAELPATAHGLAPLGANEQAATFLGSVTEMATGENSRRQSGSADSIDLLDACPERALEPARDAIADEERERVSHDNMRMAVQSVVSERMRRQ